MSTLDNRAINSSNNSSNAILDGAALSKSAPLPSFSRPSGTTTDEAVVRELCEPWFTARIEKYGTSLSYHEDKLEILLKLEKHQSEGTFPADIESRGGEPYKQYPRSVR